MSDDTPDVHILLNPALNCECNDAVKDVNVEVVKELTQFKI